MVIPGDLKKREKTETKVVKAPRGVGVDEASCCFSTQSEVTLESNDVVGAKGLGLKKTTLILLKLQRLAWAPRSHDRRGVSVFEVGNPKQAVDGVENKHSEELGGTGVGDVVWRDRHGRDGGIGSGVNDD